MSEPMPTLPTQSPFTYPNPNSSASPSFTQDDTFMPNMPEPIQPMPTFTQTAFSQPAVHTQHTHPAQTNSTGQQYPNNVQSQQFQQFQTATISANNAKFPYLEKEKYEIWAMKMEYWIQNADHNLWRIVQQGNSPKRLGKDAKGNTIVHPPVSLDEHVAVQRENKVRTLLLQALPEDHMPDFHHYDDARDIWMAVKARFGGNEESKKMKKTMLKQQFAEFSVTEEEGLHKGYDRFQKILSQLNQVQARPDNDDINLKFLRALPSSWSQVALALKTRGGLESMSFDDLYNKLRSLELDVRIGHSYGVKVAVAPTHSAFIGTACSGSKPTYSDQQRIVPSVSQTSGRSDNVMECVLHSFVAENEQDQDMIYEDFDQVDQLEMEEMDLKWQMAMLSLRINRFEKKAGRKMNYNNQQPARFDRRKVRCYKCLQLGHFARECNVKTVDDKARYSAFKVTEVKTDEPKALVSVDSMVNWSDHAAENKTGEVEKVYGMMAGLHADNGGAGISNAADEFAMMGISPKVQNCPLGCDSKINDLNHMYNNLDRLYNDCYIKVQAYQHAVKTLESQKDWYHKTQMALEEKIRVLSANLENTTNTLSYTEKLHDQAQKEKKEWEVKFEATLARFEKWKESSKNLKKLINSSMSTRTKIGLGFQEYFGVDEVFDLSTPKQVSKDSSSFVESSLNVDKETVFPVDKKGKSKGTGMDEVQSTRKCFGKPQQDDTGFVDSGCSRHMTGNIDYLSDFKEFDEDMLHLGEEHMVLPDETRILLKIPRKDNMYSLDMKNIIPKESLTCLVVKAKQMISSIWHRSLFHNIMDDFCKEKGIRREYSVAKTPEQNGVAKRMNRTLIKAARTMLADSKLPTTFWVEAVSTACYVQNKVLVVKPHNKTPYELFRGLKPALNFMRPFGCHVTILNTLVNLGKFDGKSDEGFFVGYSLSSKAFRVQSLMNVQKDASYFDSPSKDVGNGEPKSATDDQRQVQGGPYNKNDEKDKSDDDSSHNTASPNEEDNTEEEPEVDLGNITNSYIVPTTPNTRIHKDHPIDNVIGEVQSTVQTRRMLKPTSEQGFLSDVYEQKTHDTLNTCLYACFLSQIEPTSIAKALSDSSWVEAMQEELLQFKHQQVWILVDLPNGKKAIVTKWVFENKKEERGIVIRNKARIEAIRLFLAYASFVGFLVYQMDVKSALLYGTIEEEVYVTQTPGFKDPDHPDIVYKVVKALYGLHQAPRAWSETLANYLLSNEFKRGKIDQTLFIKKQKGDILLV
ncbi:putative ribonuclease H-like domain-containing protein [Tanacetum coccineum]